MWDFQAWLWTVDRNHKEGFCSVCKVLFSKYLLRDKFMLLNSVCIHWGSNFHSRYSCAAAHLSILLTKYIRGKVTQDKKVVSCVVYVALLWKINWLFMQYIPERAPMHVSYLANLHCCVTANHHRLYPLISSQVIWKCCDGCLKKWSHSYVFQNIHQLFFVQSTLMYNSASHRV